MAYLYVGIPLNLLFSIAKTLGALSVTPRVFDLLPESNVISKVASDKEAIYACERFIGNFYKYYYFTFQKFTWNNNCK